MGSIFSINSPLWNTVNRLLHFLWLSMLWFFCSLPVITMGASTTALYSVCLKYAKNEEGYLTSSFFRAMRQNFRQSTIIWLIFMVTGGILGVDLMKYFHSLKEGVVPMLILTFFFSVLVVFILSGIFVFALQAQYENTIRKTIFNSFVMAVRHWPSSLTMLFTGMGILLLGFLAFPPILFFAPALISYINCRMLIRVFAHYIPVK